jgi:putative transposase
MAWEVKHNPMERVLELLSEEGLDGAGEALRVLLNAAMLMERERHLGAGPWERNDARQGQANGFKPKTVASRVGELHLAVPQVREGGFYPSALQRGLRSERALTLALAEMYVQGVSTRKVAAVVEDLCGVEVTSSQVSRAAAELDAALRAWRERPLGACPYVYLDARYEKVREGGMVRDCAVLIALGVTANGQRQVLGVSVALSEAEAHWRAFLQGLQRRGLSGVKLFISDAHEGLNAARQAVFPSVPWQRCQFHLHQNAQSYVPKKEMKGEVAAVIRAIFNAPNQAEAERLLKQAIERFEKTAPRLAAWLEATLPQGFTVFAFPEAHRRCLRTSKVLERVNQEIKRRTRVARLFPHPASCERLVSAILMEISEDWETGKVYLTME